jgi:hypothetical protein
MHTDVQEDISPTIEGAKGDWHAYQLVPHGESQVLRAIDTILVM